MKRVLILALALAACGGEAKRTTTPDENALRAKVASFSHIALPASARDFSGENPAGIDESVIARFVIDRDDVDKLVDSANFEPPLQKDYQPYANTEHGWHLDRIHNLLGGQELKDGFSRELVIDLDKPDVATVYLIASET
jgi:hypothetical protein